MTLLVSCVSTRTTFCVSPGFAQGQPRVNPQNRNQNHTTKNFAKFPKHFPQLTDNNLMLTVHKVHLKLVQTLMQ